MEFLIPTTTNRSGNFGPFLSPFVNSVSFLDEKVPEQPLT
jgi:hypothetical protein